MVEVIGLDPRSHQASEQAFEHRRVVVHTLEEHGLPQERNAGLRELAAGGTERQRELSRMVRVDRDIERLFRIERGDQGGTDPSGIDHRHPRMKANHLRVLDLVERPHDLCHSTR